MWAKTHSSVTITNYFVNNRNSGYEDTTLQLMQISQERVQNYDIYKTNC